LARSDKEVPVEGYEHSGAKRTNNPPVGLAHLDREETPQVKYVYDPNLDPQLNWAGKAERPSFEISAPSIHVHEELSAKKILSTARKTRVDNFLFSVEELTSSEVVEFYEHELSWTNRLILGDSLIVMNSLLSRERMAGQVQCVYMDPPYGVKYNSNFQTRIGDTDVKDKSDDDLTREPEMIQAYRDTWELGIHSYLTYLRDRLVLARQLLSESGSIFLQISDDNVHLVRTLLDEVFGATNFMRLITFSKTATADSAVLPVTHDFIVWYAKDSTKVKVNPLYVPRVEKSENGTFTWVEFPDGTYRRMTKDELTDPSTLPAGSRRFRSADASSQGESKSGSRPVTFEGRDYTCSKGRHWNDQTLYKLIELGRVMATGNTLCIKRYEDEFPWTPLTSVWNDTAVGTYSKKRYVVQTSERAVERCIVLATDPGDLVLDPTCGSGTTAAVAEKFGRRWITTDTSRVAASIARERLLTQRFDYFELQDPERGVDSGFKYRIESKLSPGDIAKGLDAEQVTFFDQPIIDKRKVRVSGPFTFDALSRYAENPFDENPVMHGAQALDDHVEELLSALKTLGIPQLGKPPTKIVELNTLENAGPIQAEGLTEIGGKQTKFAISLGPKFGQITMAQVQEALTSAIGYDLIVFAGFAVSPDAAEKISKGKIGSTPVSLLLASPDLILGDLLKNTKSSQTFRLYSAPDVRLDKEGGTYLLSVLGVDTFDAASGETVSIGQAGIKAWFLDSEFDSQVFRATQAFFPDSDGWGNLKKALRNSIDSEILDQMSGWVSIPFERPESGKIAIRVVTQDGNSSEVVLSID
jgi:adenine-specific DNA-methyltransferase